MLSLAQAISPRPSVFDRSQLDTVLDLTNLIEDKIDVPRFFTENYRTEGMSQLLTLGLRRLAAKNDSEQGVFLLSQAMGGGKTHCMITLGLLARNAEYRKPFLGELHDSSTDPRDVRVIGFSGRESDAPGGLWGALAGQLGKSDLLKDHYAPLRAPGQSAWINLLQGPPTLILLDELPPYFESAAATSIGNSDLARVTATALSNLLVAVNKPELRNVCVVISDLKASYEGGSSQLQDALSNLEKETARTALPLSPVRLNSDEFFHILRTRLFEDMPAESEIGVVADAYAEVVKQARGMDLCSASPEETARQLRLSYPFHFSLRDLSAKFRENAGFQQTRGLIRLMKILAAQLWESKRAAGQYLIHPYDLDFNRAETTNEIEKINPSLNNAIAHDIADEGKSVAERIDAERKSPLPDTQDASRLLLVSSLATASGATVGLSLPDTLAFLCRPGRDVAALKKDVLGLLSTRAWYLHTDRDGRLFFKNVENIVAKLRTKAENTNPETRRKELASFLTDSFSPTVKDCYQEVFVLRPLDELQLDPHKVTLVIVEPNKLGGLTADIQSFFADTQFKNRVLFLTGDHAAASQLSDRAAELRAIRGILEEMAAEKVSETDPQHSAALDLQEKIKAQLLSALREAFTKLYFPQRPGSDDILAPAEFTLNFAGNHYRGEQQIRQTLLEKQKLATDTDSETFRKKCEQRLFTQQQMPWSEIKQRAGRSAKWQWHLPNALDVLKSRLLLEDKWREDGGFVDKGPFPPSAPTVRVQELGRDPETGRVTLRLAVSHGDTVHYEIGQTPATTASAKVKDPGTFETAELHHTFLATDSTGAGEAGPVVAWSNRLTLRFGFFSKGGDLHCELKCAPPAPVFYSTDGSDPAQGGGSYSDPFVVPKGARLILAVAEKDGLRSETLRADVPQDGETVTIDESKPYHWTPGKPHNQFQTTQESYAFLDHLAKIEGALSGLRIEVIGKNWLNLEADKQVRFTRSQIDALLKPMRESPVEGEVGLSFKTLHFPLGRDLIAYLADRKLKLDPAQIEQTLD